jgi:hypothetical protein
MTKVGTVRLTTGVQSIMSRLKDVRRTVTTGITTSAGLLVCASIVFGGTVFTRLSEEFKPELAQKASGSVLADFGADLCPFVMILAAGIVFVKPRLGSGLGLLAGILAVPWLVLTEAAIFEGSWPVLNYTGNSPSDQELSHYVKWRILSVVLIAMSTACCSLRLLPRRWLFRGRPLCERSWPCFIAGAVVLAAWFLNSAQPYRIPLIADGPSDVIRILHVEKQGLFIRENLVSTSREGRFISHWHERWLFQYGFEGHTTVGLLDAATSGAVTSMVTTSPLHSTRTPPAEQLRSWNADGWYVVLEDRRLLAFTTENRLKAPREVIDLLHRIESLPTQGSADGLIRDVCLGFCYGPVAALGFVYPNQPCFKLTSHRTDCW